jgi:hypothetical protein
MTTFFRLFLALCLVCTPSRGTAQRGRAFTDVRAEPLRISVALSHHMGTYTASHNEFIDGEFRTLAGQVAKPVVRWKRTTLAWLGELSPLMLVTSEAPPNRLPLPGVDPDANDPSRLARYTRRRGYGVGLSPLGAEATLPLDARTALAVNVTSGAAWFTQVVPYGRATQANFTVAPGVMLERRLGREGVLAMGYVLHHLSNASMGGANPGMNTHLVSMRWTR